MHPKQVVPLYREHFKMRGEDLIDTRGKRITALDVRKHSFSKGGSAEFHVRLHFPSLCASSCLRMTGSHMQSACWQDPHGRFFRNQVVSMGVFWLQSYYAENMT